MWQPILENQLIAPEDRKNITLWGTSGTVDYLLQGGQEADRQGRGEGTGVKEKAQGPVAKYSIPSTRSYFLVSITSQQPIKRWTYQVFNPLLQVKIPHDPITVPKAHCRTLLFWEQHFQRMNLWWTSCIQTKTDEQLKNLLALRNCQNITSLAPIKEETQAQSHRRCGLMESRIGNIKLMNHGNELWGTE